ncbi:MAG: hypothetical protein NVSMB14_04480 [Isosphaeraceae bacterium]
MSIKPTPDPDVPISQGGYADKFKRNRILNWSHGSRFETGRRLVEPFAGRRLLDYGCGDGIFLAKVLDLFPDAVGVDVDPKQNADCRARFAEIAPKITFLDVEPDLDDPRHDHAYDIITCMETLEHCPDDVVDQILDLLARLVAPEGTIIISVPIEIGFSLFAKEFLRSIIGLKIKDYSSRRRYRPAEMFKMVFAGENTAIERPSYLDEFEPGQFSRHHDHKGFNWKALRRKIRERFELRRLRFTPLGWTRGWLSSQVWFICRARPGK